MESAPGRHLREHRSLLASAERRLLVWMAARLPQRVSSDHLTTVGLVAMVAAGAAFATARWWDGALAVAVIALAVNWLGDSLDGTVARVRRRERPRYGFYVDHVIDLAGATCLLAGAAVSGYMSPETALAVLVGYLLVAGEAFLATHALGVFRVSVSGFGPTELRIVLAIGLLTLLRSPWVTLPGLGTYRLFDVGGVVAAAGLGVAFVSTAIRHTRALQRAEPVPGSTP